MPSPREKLANLLGPRLRSLSILVALVGFYLLTVFGAFDRRCVQEEHSLNAGAARPHFSVEWAVEVERRVEVLRSNFTRVEGNPWVGLHSFLHDSFSASSLPLLRVGEGREVGQRHRDGPAAFYTLVESERGDSRESLALVAGLDLGVPLASPSNAEVLALTTVLAHFLETVPYMTKDVFVVFCDKRRKYGASARSFLEAYLYGGREVQGRGLLRQAVVLQGEPGEGRGDADFFPLRGEQSGSPVFNFNSVSVRYEGPSGWVPNQDAVNAFVVEAFAGGRFVPSVPPLWDAVFSMASDELMHALHVPFLEAMIPSYTVVLTHKDHVSSKTEILQVARSLEGALRALSNLFQSLHHSFNFYFFTKADRHVSSGTYLYPVFAMQIPLVAFIVKNRFLGSIRGLLASVSAVGLLVMAGMVPFLIATQAQVADLIAPLALVFEGTEGGLEFGGLSVDPSGCAGLRGVAGEGGRREAVAFVWGILGVLSCVAVSILFLAFMDHEALEFSEEGRRKRRKGSGEGERALRSSLLFALFPLVNSVLFNWAMSVFLTLLLVPVILVLQNENEDELPPEELEASNDALEGHEGRADSDRKGPPETSSQRSALRRVLGVMVVVVPLLFFAPLPFASVLQARRYVALWLHGALSSLHSGLQDFLVPWLLGILKLPSVRGVLKDAKMTPDEVIEYLPYKLTGWLSGDALLDKYLRTFANTDTPGVPSLSLVYSWAEDCVCGGGVLFPLLFMLVIPVFSVAGTLAVLDFVKTRHAASPKVASLKREKYPGSEKRKAE